MTTVVILTPLALEFDAVSRLLPGKRERAVQKGEVYESGIFPGKHDTYQVILCEPGIYNLGMALATEKAIQLFQPHIVLLVGIAGGIKDVKIGNVLIANKVYGIETGKEEVDGFKARPSVESFSRDLLAQAKLLRRTGDWKKRTSDGAPAADVFIGPIAAGDKVVAGIKNPAFERIKLHYNDTLGVEMEAIGFATALQGHRHIHGLAIRGISDLCKGKSKTDKQEWQPVAAERAAAVAFELLYEMDATPFIQINMDVKKIAKDVYDLLFPQALKEIGSDFVSAANNDIRELWKKVKPIFIEEVKDLAKDPDDTLAQGSVEMKLRKALEKDELLGSALSELVERLSDDSPKGSVNVVNSKNVVVGSTLNISGDFLLGDNYSNVTGSGNYVIQGSNHNNINK